MRNYFLKTDRIGFSKWTKDDIELANLLWGDENVTKYICATGKFTEEEILNRLQLEIGNNEQFAVQYWPIFSLELPIL